MALNRPSYRPSVEELEPRDLLSTSPIGGIADAVAAKLEQSLVAHWSGDGTAADARGVSNGILEGNRGFASGKIGSAFSIDRPEAFVVMPSATALNFGTNEAFSLGAWAQVTDVSAIAGDSALCLLRKGNLDQTGATYGMALRPGMGALDVWLQGSGSGRIYWRGSVGVDVTGWHHYAMSYDGSGKITGLRVYVDGKELQPTYSENALSTSLKNDGPVAIARAFAADPVAQFAPGTVDDVTVRVGALSAEEVAAVFAMDEFRALPPALSAVEGPAALTSLVESAAEPIVEAPVTAAAVPQATETASGPLYHRAAITASTQTEAGWALTVAVASPGNSTRFETTGGQTIATVQHPGGTRKTAITLTYPDDGQNQIRVIDGDSGRIVQLLENRRTDGTFGLRPGIDVFSPAGQEPADAARNTERTIPDQITVDQGLVGGNVRVRFSTSLAGGGINVYDDNKQFSFQRLISCPGGIANGEVLLDLPDGNSTLIFSGRFEGAFSREIVIQKSGGLVRILAGGGWQDVEGAWIEQAPAYHLPLIDAPSLRDAAKHNIMAMAGLEVTESAEQITRRIAPWLFVEDASASARAEQIWSVQKEMGYVEEVIREGAAAAFSQLLDERMGKPAADAGSVERALSVHPRIGVFGGFGVIPDAATVRAAVALKFDQIYARLCGIEGEQQALWNTQNAVVVPPPATVSPEAHERIMDTILQSPDGIGSREERIANYVEANPDAVAYIPTLVRAAVLTILDDRRRLVASAGTSTDSPWEWVGPTPDPTATQPPPLSPAAMREMINSADVIRSMMQNGTFETPTIQKFAELLSTAIIRRMTPIYQAIDAVSDAEAFEILRENGMVEYHAGSVENSGKLILIINGHSQELTEGGQHVGMNALAEKFHDHEVLHFTVGSALNPVTLNPDAVYQATMRILQSRIARTGVFASAPPITHLGGAGYSWGAGTLAALVNSIRPTADYGSAPFPIDIAMVDAVELGYSGLTMPVQLRPNADHVFNRYQENGNATFAALWDEAAKRMQLGDSALTPSYIDGPVQLALLLNYLKQAIIDRGEPANGTGLVGFQPGIDDERRVEWSINPETGEIVPVDHINIDDQWTLEPTEDPRSQVTLIDAAYDFLTDKLAAINQ